MGVSFNLDKGKVKQAFSQAALTYDRVTQLQRTVGKALLRNIDNLCTNDNVLDLGCGTGFLTQEFLALLPCQQIIALDLALPMLKAAKVKLKNFDKVIYVCADAEQLPMAEHAVDHVFSNLMLQWCVDIKSVFIDLRRVLKPGGQLVFSIFGPQTLRELKQAWGVVDNYSHVNYFYGMDELKDFLQQSGFNILKCQNQLYTVEYESVLALMRELKDIGAHNVNASRNKQLTTQRQMQQMVAAYPKCQVNHHINATFDVITIIACR